MITEESGPMVMISEDRVQRAPAYLEPACVATTTLTTAPAIIINISIIIIIVIVVIIITISIFIITFPHHHLILFFDSSVDQTRKKHYQLNSLSFSSGMMH